MSIHLLIASPTELRIHDDIERGDNETIKSAGEEKDGKRIGLESVKASTFESSTTRRGGEA